MKESEERKQPATKPNFWDLLRLWTAADKIKEAIEWIVENLL